MGGVPHGSSRSAFDTSSVMTFARLFVVLWIMPFSTTAPAETVRTAIPRATVNYLSPRS